MKYKTKYPVLLLIFTLISLNTMAADLGYKLHANSEYLECATEKIDVTSNQKKARSVKEVRELLQKLQDSSLKDTKKYKGNLFINLIAIPYSLLGMFAIGYILLEFDVLAFRKNRFFKSLLEKYKSLTFKTQMLFLLVLCVVLIVSFFFLDILVYGTETILASPNPKSAWRYEGFPKELGYWSILCFPIFLCRKVILKDKKIDITLIRHKKKSLVTELNETMILCFKAFCIGFYVVALYMMYLKVVAFLYI